MLRSAIVVTGLLAGGAAAAGPDEEDTREDALLFEVTPVRIDELTLVWHVDLVGAGLADTGGTAAGGGLASASAEVGLAGPGCDVVAAGGQLEARSDDRVLSAQQWASTCPVGGNGALSFDHRLEWDVAPRLLAPPRMLTGRHRRETVGVDFVGSVVPGSTPADTEAGGGARLEIGVLWSPDEPQDVVAPLFDVVLRTFSHDHGDDGPPREISIAAARLAGIMETGIDGDTSVSLSLDPVRVSGLRWRDLRFGGRLGGRFIGMTHGPAGAYRMASGFVGEGGASVERDLRRGVTARLELDRDGWAVWDGRFAVDDRATASLAAERGHGRTRVELAVGSTHLLDAEAHRHDVVTGGVTAEAELDLGAYVTLKARTEAGRSVYATATNPDMPVWASESLLLLALRAGNR